MGPDHSFPARAAIRRPHDSLTQRQGRMATLASQQPAAIGLRGMKPPRRYPRGGPHPSHSACPAWEAMRSHAKRVSRDAPVSGRPAGSLACWAGWEVSGRARLWLDRTETYLTGSLTTIRARWPLTRLAAVAFSIRPATGMMLILVRPDAGPAEAAAWLGRRGFVVAPNLRTFRSHHGECARDDGNGEGVHTCLRLS